LHCVYFRNTNRNMPQNYTYPEPLDLLNELTSYDYEVATDLKLT